jgi:hypothetical protein
MTLINKNNNIDSAELQSRLTELLHTLDSACIASKFALANDYAAPAKALEIINTEHANQAVISLYLAEQTIPALFAEKLPSITGKIQHYWVKETAVLSQEEKPGPLDGLCQIALLKKPAALSYEKWLYNWQALHTKVAVETQSNFIYRQNVCENLDNTNNNYQIDAIVEEVFPADAMTDRQLFFNAKDNEDLYKANEAKMIESCLRFIDFNHFDCLPMQEIVVKAKPHS